MLLRSNRLLTPKTACAIATLALSLATALAAPIGAQTASGVGDDAIPIPVHGTRIRIAGLWSSYDSRFVPTPNGTERHRLLSGFNRDNLGVADIPALAVAQQNIRALSGLGTAFTLSLGKLEARGDVSRSIVPFQMDVGITRRLSVGFMVPYVETSSQSKLVLNRGGLGATVGENPAKLEASEARATNGIVLQQIAASRAALTAEISRCNDVNAVGGGCAAIRANPTSAQTLLAQSAAASNQILSVYGNATSATSPLVPIQQSVAQKAIEANLTALRASFETFASNNMAAATFPVGATLVYGSAGLQTLARNATLGLSYDTLANGGRAGMGDLDVVATFLLFDSFGASQSKRLLETKRGVRTAVSAGWRFGTATGGRSGNPFDVPTGDGANALLARSTTDVIINHRYWVSATVRYLQPLSDRVVSHVPMVNDSSLFWPFQQLPADRKLGSRMEFEIAPRAAIGKFFGVSMAYGIGRQAISTITPDAVPGLPDIAGSGAAAGTVYSTPAATAQSFQFGATFSTLNGFLRAKSRWPIEAIYTHGMTLRGSGGSVPIESFDRAELRIYTRFPRR